MPATSPIVSKCAVIPVTSVDASQAFYTFSSGQALEAHLKEQFSALEDEHLVGFTI
jgi:hypothetical protein